MPGPSHAAPWSPGQRWATRAGGDRGGAWRLLGGCGSAGGCGVAGVAADEERRTGDGQLPLERGGRRAQGQKREGLGLRVRTAENLPRKLDWNRENSKEPTFDSIWKTGDWGGEPGERSRG